MPSISRRQYLSTVSATAIAAVAGCQQNSCTPTEPRPADWPQFRGNASNTNAAPELPTLNQTGEFWTADIGAITEVTGLALTDNSVVVVGEASGEPSGVISTPELSDGEADPSHELERTPTMPPAISASIAVIPVLGSYTDPSTGGIIAIDLDSWTESWTHNLSGRPNPPTVVDARVLVSSDNGHVAMLDTASGDTEWTRTFGDDRQNGAIPAPPAVDETRVYVSVLGSAAQGLYALDRESGETVWSIPGPDIPNPLVRTGDVVLGSYREHELAAFDVETGESQWSQAIHDGELFPPAVGDGRVFSADQEAVYALNLETGESDWEEELAVEGAPVVVGDSVVVPTQDSLVGLAASDGAQQWTVSESPDTACIPVEGGFVYGSENSVMVQTNCK